MYVCSQSLIRLKEYDNIQYITKQKKQKTNMERKLAVASVWIFLHTQLLLGITAPYPLLDKHIKL